MENSKEKNEILKRKNGITLISLVITIIILLILATISIQSLTNTGLFEKAKEAKEKTEGKALEENEILTNYLEQMDATLGEQITETIPDGATVMPIDDVTIWLKTGGLSYYSYTDIEQVIADNICIESLMNNENAMKYFTRSIGFANAICESEKVMTYLGKSTFVDDTVLNSDLWLSKIRASKYWQKLANVSVTVYGGAFEKITISGLGGSPVVTTNASGSVNYSLIKGTYTFTGSVSGQAFTRTVTNDTDIVYAMPENALFWYGYRCTNATFVRIKNSTSNLSAASPMSSSVSDNMITLVCDSNGVANVGAYYKVPFKWSELTKYNDICFKAYANRITNNNNIMNVGWTCQKKNILDNGDGLCIWYNPDSYSDRVLSQYETSKNIQFNSSITGMISGNEKNKGTNSYINQNDTIYLYIGTYVNNYYQFKGTVNIKEFYLL